jgi:D-alanine-D-alanine ligase
MRVLLIAGGWSNEREVSLAGAAQIEKALLATGCRVDRLDPAEEFDRIGERAAACDAAFLNLHGSPGEDGLIQALLDAAGVPYQGAGPAGSMLALHKAAAKQLMRRAGLPTPDWEFLPVPPPSGWRTSLRFPLFVKPEAGGSSLAMSRVESAGELAPALEAVFSAGFPALLEEAVDGVELTCAVLGEAALPPILIRPAGGRRFFDYQSKYAVGGAEEICPAPVSAELTGLVQDQALAVHRLLGLSGVSRTDFMVAGETAFVLEVNTLPGMTPTSLVPKAAAAAGLDFPALIRRLLELALAERAKGRMRP